MSEKDKTIPQKSSKRQKSVNRVVSSLYEDTLYAMNTGDISSTIPEDVFNFLPPQCMYDRLKNRKRRTSDTDTTFGSTSSSSGYTSSITGSITDSENNFSQKLTTHSKSKSPKTLPNRTDKFNFTENYSLDLQESPKNSSSNTKRKRSLSGSTKKRKSSSKSRNSSSGTSQDLSNLTLHGHPPGEYVPFSKDELKLKESSSINTKNLPGKEISKQDLQKVKSNDIQEVQTVLDENGDEVKIFWIQEKFLGKNRMICHLDRLPRIFNDFTTFNSKSCSIFNNEQGFNYQIVKKLLEKSNDTCMSHPLKKYNCNEIKNLQNFCYDHDNVVNDDTNHEQSFDNEDQASIDSTISTMSTISEVNESIKLYEEKREKLNKREQNNNQTQQNFDLSDLLTKFGGQENDNQKVGSSLDLESIISDLKKVENLVDNKSDDNHDKHDNK